MSESKLANLDHHYAALPNTLVEYAQQRPLIQDDRTRTRYRGIWNRYFTERGEAKYGEKVVAIMQSIIDREKNGDIGHSTFRQHKAAFLFGLSTLITVEGELNVDYDDQHAGIEYYEELYTYFKNYAPVNKSSKVAKKSNEKQDIQAEHNFDLMPQIEEATLLRTSAKKKKNFPEAIFNWIQRVDTQRRPAIEFLQLFLRANLLLGLRPVEWRDVRLACTFDPTNPMQQGCPSIVVTNAKNTFGRANGDYRILVLKDITEEEKADIIRFKRAFEADLRNLYADFKAQCEAYYSANPDDRDGEHAQGQKRLDIQHGLGKTWNPIFPEIPLEDIIDEYGNIQPELAHRRMATLQRALSRLLDECPHVKKTEITRPTLYSLRHQCIANAKMSKIPVVEVAAFFGHASVKTARTHYAKAGSGWKKFKFEADAESIAAVNYIHPSEQKEVLFDENIHSNNRPDLGEIDEFDNEW